MDEISKTPIKDCMVTDVVYLRKGDSMSEACDKMRNHNIRHLPVLDDEDRVIGIFTDADLNQAYKPRKTESGWYYDAAELNRLDLEAFMRKEPSVLYPNNTLKDAAGIMARNKFGCIVIVCEEDKRLAGILTYIDILRRIALVLALLLSLLVLSAAPSIAGGASYRENGTHAPRDEASNSEEVKDEIKESAGVHIYPKKWNEQEDVVAPKWGWTKPDRRSGQDHTPGKY